MTNGTGRRHEERRPPRGWRRRIQADSQEPLKSGFPWLGWTRVPSWVERLAKAGLSGQESEELALRRESLILMACGIDLLALVWVVTYASLGLYIPALIPFGYQVITTVGLLLLARTGRFHVFRATQLGLMLLLPVLLQWSLGGFRSSSGVMLWSLTAPLGALVFTTRPGPWFFGYLGLTVVSGLLEPLLTPAPIPRSVNVTFFVLNVVAVSGVVYFLLRYFILGLAKEREKSESLLLNVLPSSIARRLKAGERPVADRFEEAAVLFADIVDFTPMSDQVAPDAMVEFLDGLFTELDALIERHGLEKIKTVGDAYMAVGGVDQLQTAPIEAVAEAAMDMKQRVDDLRSPNGERLALRIGIDIGPVVAGVIGTRKFAYDLWGDTVNTASRMESHGVPGEIQVTERAFQRLADQYIFRLRGLVEVKGKGRISTYLLLRHKEAAAVGARCHNSES